MRKLLAVLLGGLMISSVLLSGCGKKEEATTEAEATGEAASITMVNIKSEINTQLEELAKAYQAETGVEVKIMNVPAGVDAQATLKGYYLSDQMPDIIACEAAGFSNWEGLLADMSDQDWAKRTEAAYVDSTYGTIGFPYTTEAIGLAYNADILEKCGGDPASITGPAAMRSAFEAVDAKKDDLGLKAVVAYSAEPVNLGWSAGNHITGAYIDSGLSRDDTTYIHIIS